MRRCSYCSRASKVCLASWGSFYVSLTLASLVHRAGTPSEVLSLLRRLDESQRELKQVVTVFSAAALDLWASCSTTDTERDWFRNTLIANYEVAAPGGCGAWFLGAWWHRVASEQLISGRLEHD